MVRKNSCIFPAKNGISTETGLFETPCTHSQLEIVRRSGAGARAIDTICCAFMHKPPGSPLVSSGRALRPEAVSSKMRVSGEIPYARKGWVQGARMSGLGQILRFEERCPNGCFLVHKRPLREAPVNGRSWPKVALRRHRKCIRLCDSHEGLESTHNGHLGSLMRTSVFGTQS